MKKSLANLTSEDLRKMTMAQICDLVIEMSKIIKEQQLIIEQNSVEK